MYGRESQVGECVRGMRLYQVPAPPATAGEHWAACGRGLDRGRRQRTVRLDFPAAFLWSLPLAGAHADCSAMAVAIAVWGG